MGYRFLASENVDWATVHYLRKIDNDIEWTGDVLELGVGADVASIAAHAEETNQLNLTRIDDFLTELTIEKTPRVLFQKYQTLSARGRGYSPRNVPAYRPD